ncbi:uncharacterized protein LJ206_000354 isoform 2-T2 [Theristicus caerulescens]
MRLRLELLLLVAGAVAAPGLSPAPLGLLSQEDGGPPTIICLAPRSYAGSTFELFAAGAGVPAQSVSAEPDQHKVDFTLDRATPASRCYRCRYRSYNGSAWQTSAFSMEIMVNGAGGRAPPGRRVGVGVRRERRRPKPGVFLPSFWWRRLSSPPPPPRPAVPCPLPPPCGKIAPGFSRLPSARPAWCCCWRQRQRWRPGEAAGVVLDGDAVPHHRALL